jgi:negative regulator of replication initiation
MFDWAIANIDMSKKWWIVQSLLLIAELAAELIEKLF